MNNLTLLIDDIPFWAGENLSWNFSNVSDYYYDDDNGNTFDDQMFTFYRDIIVTMNTYAYPFISLTGLTGNSLAFVTFISLNLRKVSCNLYLATRAITDSGLLLLIFVYWLEMFDIFLVNSDVLCRMVTFLSYIFAFLSVWLVLAVTLENYIRICYPFHASRFCTVSTANKVIVLLVLVSVILYNFAIWTTHSIMQDDVVSCRNNNTYAHLLIIMTYVDTLVTFLLPSGLAIFMIISIFYNSFKNSRRRGQGENKRLNLQSKVTRMLLVVSVVFLVLNLPLHVFRTRMLLPSLITGQYLAERVAPSAYLINSVLLLLYYTSSAINCLLYLSCGVTFRNEFVRRFFYCNRVQIKKDTDASQVSTDRMAARLSNELEMSSVKLSEENDIITNDV